MNQLFLKPHIWVLLAAMSALVHAEEAPICVEIPVRVLLDTQIKDQQISWTLYNKNGFSIAATQDASCLYETEESELIFSYKNNKLYLGTKCIGPQSITIIPRDRSSIRFKNYWYEGSFIIHRDTTGIYVVNSIPLEDYVYSVVRWESWPGWPLEVNKAFAIAVRSYVLSKIFDARGSKKPHKKIYDIKSTNFHQTYKGAHSFNEIRRAVEETRGVILTYDGKPIIAMYDCCCGGIIPAHMQGIDFKSAPYLARNYACTFCKNSKLFSWKLTYSAQEFESLLHNKSHMIHGVKDISVKKRDKAGIAHTIEIKTNRKNTLLTGKEIYSLCKDIKSFKFNCEFLKSGKIVIKGEGYGHHQGLCQWGSREMERKGWDHESMLRFYYPGTTFMKITSGYL